MPSRWAGRPKRPTTLSASAGRGIEFYGQLQALVNGGCEPVVERMLSLHKQLAAAKTPTVKTHLQRQIDSTDREIDLLVYELYGLTEEEIRILEGG